MMKKLTLKKISKIYKEKIYLNFILRININNNEIENKEKKIEKKKFNDKKKKKNLFKFFMNKKIE